MDVEKMYMYGLLYLFLAIWLATVLGDIYKSRLRHRADMDARVKGHTVNLQAVDALGRLAESSRQSMLDALASLAMQKSLVLVERASGDWEMSVMDTSSKELVREFLERQTKLTQELKKSGNESAPPENPQ